MKRILSTLCTIFVLLTLSGCNPAELGFHWITPEAVPLPTEEVGIALPDPLPTPPCEVVKANISRDGRKIYHVEGQANFNTVRIDEAAGERFFCSPAEAEAAGWVRAGN